MFKNIKKNLFIIGVAIVIGGLIFWLWNYQSVQAGIKVLDYVPPSKYSNKAIQVDKYDNIKGVWWINENEILTFTSKDDGIYYCGIYNLNTKEIKEFKNVSICDFYGVSPDGKHVLYSEERIIPEVDSKEWKKALDSGDLLNKKIKILNLQNGNIEELSTEKINSDAEFIWISSEKILINYCDHWAITDLSGNVYKNGNFGLNKEYDYATIAGVDDLIDKGNGIEGQLYFYENVEGKIGTNVCSIDINSMQKKLLHENKNPDDEFSFEAYKKGNIIMIDNSKNNGKQNEDGIYENRTFGGIIMNTNGKILHDFQLDKGHYHGNFELSPNGKKAVYVETNNISKEINNSDKTTIEMIDTSSGERTEVMDFSMEESKRKIQISNLVWDKQGHSLLVTCYYVNEKKSDTYIISLDQ